ncbi:hypothetical protein Pcaca04_28040 [Pectobacterium carotovorum subsp. carotovorum]|nr:hypothetical protein Pcaca04_28040 [Pectobacterium carotovorum subsp. carotovorum]
MKDIKEVYPGIHQISSYNESVNFTVNQYLICGESPTLIHSGTSKDSHELIEVIDSLLCGRDLRFLFASHFESDECGATSILLERYREMTVLCSETTGRQLAGFGINESFLIQTEDKAFRAGDLDFRFIDYPSEVHMWNGLIALEATRSILFSSDMFVRFGRPDRNNIKSNWSSEIASLAKDRFIPIDKLAILQKKLSPLNVGLIAPGHGNCIDVLAERE